MPQMAPIWWFSLFSMFITSYIIFMMMLYFYINYSIKSKNLSKNKFIKNINWKW